MTHLDVIRALQAHRNPAKAAFFPKFFKTAPGEYGEGDEFFGITVPQIRSVVKTHRGLSLADIEQLLLHKIHEVRLAGVLLLVARYQKGDEHLKRETVDFYLAHLERVNNWDLVDSSAPYILGDWLLTHDRSVLDDFAKTDHLWTQRVAIVATYAFIRAEQFDDTQRIAELLLHHPHDLIHKAVGWMLREMGKRDVALLERFLQKHAAVMPRTMLRYALEKLPDAQKKHYMGLRKRQ